MGENSKIEWCDHTFNPWVGCSKVSTGCKNCYAENMMDKRFGRVQWGVSGTRSRTSAANWEKPLSWNRKAKEEGTRPRVFCGSLCDIFEDRPELVEWRRDLLSLIVDTPNLDWLLLTKRPENVNRMINEVCGLVERSQWFGEWLNINKHIWIGTSVENQETADKRIPELLKIPAAVRFLSAEPMLGPVVLARVPMTLSQVTDLQPGQDIVLPGGALDAVMLQVGGQEVVATGRLGKARGDRAVRLQAAATPVAQPIDGPGQDAPQPVIKQATP